MPILHDGRINETTFPNATFREWVLAQEYGADGYLTDGEIVFVKQINVYDKSIADLKGIEYFTNLTDLDCSNNKLTSLDVSKNTNLKILNCSNNQLYTLDLSKNTKLTSVYCYKNHIFGDNAESLVNNLPKTTAAALYF